MSTKHLSLGGADAASITDTVNSDITDGAQPAMPTELASRLYNK